MNELNVRLLGFSRIDYDKRPIRKTLRQEITIVRGAARAKVGRSSPSGPGEYPGRSSGVLQRAIKSKVLRGGLAAVARPEKTARMGRLYYPAFLLHGAKKRNGKVLKPGLEARADYMVDALEERTAGATDALTQALQASLVPRK